jgi:RNA polymerase sigma-70 factor (ECF subfamily)
VNFQDYENQLVDYSVEVVKWLVSRGVTLSDAEDAVQDTFVKMLEMDLVIAPDKLRSWMYRVSFRTYLDKFRRNKKYQEILHELKNELKEFTEEPLDLAFYLNQLPEYQNNLLEEYYFHKKSTKELAKQFHVTQAKVKVDLFRARNKLKKIIERQGVIGIWNI